MKQSYQLNSKFKPLLISRIGALIIFLLLSLILDYDINGRITLSFRIYGLLVYFGLFWGLFILFFVNRITISEEEVQIGYPLHIIKNKCYVIENIENLTLKQTARICTLSIQYNSDKRVKVVKHYLFGFSEKSYNQILYKINTHPKVKISVKHINAWGKDC